MHQPNPQQTIPLAQAAGALLLASLVALALNPRAPAQWARDAPLPDDASLIAARQADALQAWAEGLGLDAPGAWVSGRAQALRRP